MERLADGTYVVMDFEFNYPNTNFRSERNGIRLTEEIIEIGAVKLDGALREVDRFSCYVRPTVYTRMNNEVRKLTDITEEMILNGRAFEDAIPDFLSWCGEDAVFITWSENDIIQLEDNLLYHGLSIEGLPECYDIQLMFDDQITQEDRSFALTYALWKLGIEPESAHDALNDALNTAAVLRKLDLSEGLEGYEV